MAAGFQQVDRERGAGWQGNKLWCVPGCSASQRQWVKQQRMVQAGGGGCYGGGGGGGGCYGGVPRRAIWAALDDAGGAAFLPGCVAIDVPFPPSSNSCFPLQARVFFSAHGVPKSYVVEAGDPYKEEMVRQD